MIGQRLGHYTILRKLGSGGMGEVFLARDERLGREVALKLLPAELTDDAQRLERFEREARTVAGFNHPNIVTLHAVEEADGVRFMTMEHVQGATLDTEIPSGGLDLDRFLALAIPLADALAAAHARGVTHRDLKPANVMVTEDGRIKVLDFGLAKPDLGAVRPDDETLAAAEALTQEGALVGTVPYMSPEQIEGRPADARSDIFSLGVLLYQMASGLHPFGGESSASLMASILKDSPPSLIETRPRLPRQLERIVQHCLQKDPQRRFQSALDVRNELEALRGEEASTSADTASARQAPPAVAPARRRFGGLWVGAALLGVVLAGVFAWIVDSGREAPGGPGPGVAPTAGPAVERIVVLPFENLGAAGDEYFASGIADEITTRLASVASLGVIARNSARRYAGTTKGESEIGAELGVSYVLAGTVRWARAPEGDRVRITPRLIRVVDGLQIWSQPYEHVLKDIFETQSEIALEVIGEIGVELRGDQRQALDARPTRDLEAYQAYLRGLDSTGRQTYSRDDRLLEIEMFERAVELDPGFAHAWAALSKAHAALINLGYDRSDERVAAARRAVDRALEIDRGLPEAQIALAYFHYWGERDYDAALAAFDRAAAERPNHPEVVLGRTWIARRQGRWEEAIEGAGRAFRLDPLASDLPREIGVMYLHTRQHDLALESLDASISLAPDGQAAYALKAIVHWARGDLESARAAIADVPGAESLITIWIALNQAFFERDWAVAERLAQRLPAGPIVVFPDLMPSRAQILAELAARQGDAERAKALSMEALSEMEPMLAGTPDDARVHAALGRVYADLGNKEEALAAGRRAVELYPIGKDALHGPRQHFELAVIAARVGEPELALQQLELLLEANCWLTAPFARIDPTLDPIRDDPRFEALLARYG